ncbi:MAG: hypothetical protein P8J37_01430 [Fuerstiella sp.]|nr:hypothetical protein [Fuerstiella sp.]
MSADDEFNPYSSPLNSDGAEFVADMRSPGPFAILFVVIASIVAAGAAFFCTCLGFVASDLDRPGAAGTMIFVCCLFTLLAYMITAKFGLVVIGRMFSSAPSRSASWLVVFLSAVVVTVVFVCCTQVVGILLAACAAVAVATLLIWKQLHGSRDVDKNSEEAAGASPEIPSSLERP